MLSVPSETHVTSSDPEDEFAGAQTNPTEIIVGVRNPQSAAGLISHGMALATAFGCDIVLLHALESREAGTVPVDPIEWDIHRKDIQNLLGRCAKENAASDRTIKTCLLEGSCREQISSFLEVQPKETVIVLGEGQSPPQETGNFARAILGLGQASILRVPDCGSQRKDHAYRRILVPLDGSSRAESVLPKAVRLAKAEGSEVILCFITPPPGVAEIGVSDNEAIALRQQVNARNKRVAERYLKHVSDRLSGDGVDISTRTDLGEDVRRSLLQIAKESGADLIIMASHGQSGHSDVPAGDVASFILKRARIPVLMLRQSMKHSQEHAFSGTASEGVRQPTDLKP